MMESKGLSSASTQLVQEAADQLSRFGEARLEYSPRAGQASTSSSPDLIFVPKTGPFANRTYIVEYKVTPIGRYLSSAEAASAASTLIGAWKTNESVHSVVVTNSKIGVGAQRVLDNYKILYISSVDNSRSFVDAILRLARIRSSGGRNPNS